MPDKPRDREGRDGGGGRDGLGADDLDRMLDGRGDPSHELAALHEALRAPGRPEELRGEAAALAAFRAAGRPPATPVRSAGAPVRRRRVVRRLLAVKVAVGVAVLAGGGLAVAAVSTGVFVPTGSPPVTTPRADAGGGAPTGPVDHGGAGPTVHRSGDVDLCRRFAALPEPDRAAALDVPPLRELAEQAGGRERVGAFCTSAGVPVAAVPPVASPTPILSGQPGNGNGSGSPTTTAGPPKPPKPSKSPKAPKTPKDKPTKPPNDPPGPPGHAAGPPGNAGAAAGGAAGNAAGPPGHAAGAPGNA